jgi:hypothetical protein
MASMSGETDGKLVNEIIYFIKIEIGSPLRKITIKIIFIISLFFVIFFSQLVNSSKTETVLRLNIFSKTFI